MELRISPFSFEAAAANFYSALVSSYPLLVFFASKAVKKKLTVPIWARFIISSFFNFAYQIEIKIDTVFKIY